MCGENRDFDTASRTWDAEPRRVNLAKEVTGAILREIPMTKDLRVLDYGCGTGLVTLQLQPYVGSITGADSSSGMLEVLAGKIRTLGLRNVRTQLVDSAMGDRLSERFDLIVSSMTLHHVADISALFKRFGELLNPGGAVALADLDSDDGRFHDDNTGVAHFGFNREHISALLRTAGFREVNTTTATTVVKEKGEGREEFRVFLLTGRKC